MNNIIYVKSGQVVRKINENGRGVDNLEGIFIGIFITPFLDFLRENLLIRREGVTIWGHKVPRDTKREVSNKD